MRGFRSGEKHRFGFSNLTVSDFLFACSPQSLLTGINRFLELLQITFRRDPTNFRPRINKLDSIKDREQKLSGNFYFLEQEATK